MKIQRKIQFTASIIMLPVLPFAYWKMKEVYYARIKSEFDRYDQFLDYPIVPNLPISRIEDQNEIIKPDPQNRCNLFIYNHQLDYSFNFKCKSESKLNKVNSFFQGRLVKDWFDVFFKKHQFYCVNQKLNLNNQENYNKIHDQIILFDHKIISGITGFTAYHKRIKNDQSYYQINYENTASVFQIYLRRTFRTTSGVIIDNLKDRVEIRKDGRPLDLQKELLNYFDKDKITDDFAIDLTDHIKNEQPLSAKKLYNFQRAAKVGKAEVQRLQDSKILAVFAVLPNKKGKNSIIWGLSQDNTNPDPETNRFHWITDLKNDISVLFNVL